MPAGVIGLGFPEFPPLPKPQIAVMERVRVPLPPRPSRSPGALLKVIPTRFRAATAAVTGLFPLVPLPVAAGIVAIGAAHFVADLARAGNHEAIALTGAVARLAVAFSASAVPVVLGAGDVLAAGGMVAAELPKIGIAAVGAVAVAVEAAIVRAWVHVTEKVRPFSAFGDVATRIGDADRMLASGVAKVSSVIPWVVQQTTARSAIPPADVLGSYSGELAVLGSSDTWKSLSDSPMLIIGSLMRAMNDARKKTAVALKGYGKVSRLVGIHMQETQPAVDELNEALALDLQLSARFIKAKSHVAKLAGKARFIYLGVQAQIKAVRAVAKAIASIWAGDTPKIVLYFAAASLLATAAKLAFAQAAGTMSSGAERGISEAKDFAARVGARDPRQRQGTLTINLTGVTSTSTLRQQIEAALAA
jgi:hypothetical protein